MASICKNCGHPIGNKYCPQCGQKTSTSRFTVKLLVDQFIHGFFHLDHGILFTIKELAIRPGQMLKNYLAGHRVSYFNPFTFVLILGGINSFFLPRLHWHSFFIDIGLFTNRQVNQQIWDSSLKYFSARILLSVPVYSLITKCFYYKKGYNYPEHFIANTYLRGEGCIFTLLLAPLQLATNGGPLLTATKLTALFIAILYVGWAYAVLFNNRNSWPAMIKGFICGFTAVATELVLLNLIVTEAAKL